MKKCRKQKPNRQVFGEYDYSGGERGKYSATYAKGANVVVLDADVAREFPTQESVNETLRLLSNIIKGHRRKKLT